MAISLDQFTQQLADSGLMHSDEIVSFVAHLGVPVEMTNSLACDLC